MATLRSLRGGPATQGLVSKGSQALESRCVASSAGMSDKRTMDCGLGSTSRPSRDSCSEGKSGLVSVARGSPRSNAAEHWGSRSPQEGDEPIAIAPIKRRLLDWTAARPLPIADARIAPDGFPGPQRGSQEDTMPGHTPPMPTALRDRI